MRGVCSAGLATTVLPAINAAVTWPMKIASGKFHGEIATNTPRPRSRSILLSPVGPGIALVLAEQLATLFGIIAAEVGGLAHFRERIVERLAAFGLQQCNELRPALLQQIGCLLQHCGALLGRGSVPIPKSRMRGGDRAAHALRIEFGDRLGLPVIGRGCREQIAQRRALAEFDAARILALRPVEIARPWNVRMPRVIRRADDIGRAAQQRRDRNALVGCERDKGGIGAVLQQTPHQIGQQIAVAADRRIGAAGDLGAVAAELRIKRLAHAVQPLEFEASAGIGQFEDGRDRQRVVGGELRKDPRPQRQQLFARRRRSSGRSSPCG